MIPRQTLEFVLNSMYVALVSTMSDPRRELANSVLFQCADLECAPTFAPEILRRIAANAVNKQAHMPEVRFDPPPKRRFQVIDGGNSAA
jgi:hypothetical protein